MRGTTAAMREEDSQAALILFLVLSGAFYTVDQGNVPLTGSHRRL
jgi:hypothetical protein